MMIKSDLIDRITAELPRLSPVKVKKLVNQILQAMGGALAEGRHIEIRGFGSFVTHHYAAHQAHNPKTGEQLMTEATKRARFKPSKQLIKKLNES